MIGDARSPDRIVIVTGDDLEHRYVTNQLCGAFDVSRVIVDCGRPTSRFDRIGRLRRKYTPGQLLSRSMVGAVSFLARDAQVRQREIIRVLGDDADRFINRDLVSHVNGINTQDGISAVATQSPDLLIVYGTGIVGSNVLALPRRVALNMHTGVSPEYRGSDCVFWPIYNRDYHIVGATVHECTASLDGGEIYAQSRVRLSPTDTYFSAFARCVEMGSKLLVDVVSSALKGELRGTLQDLSQGKEYRAADKKLRHDLSLRWRFRSGIIERELEGDERRDP